MCLPPERASRSTEVADSQASCPQMEVLRGRDGRDGRDGGVGSSGPTGPTGEKGGQGEGGTPGEKGDRGITGARGKLGISGSRGPVGEKGNRGDPGLAGPQGPQGTQGPPTGGTVYVRWGRTVCPTGQGTELVYNGTAGGSYWTHKGGSVNIVCMPNNPDHGQFASGVQGYSYMYGVALEPTSPQPLYSAHYDKLPCAVCLATTRVTTLMIPAKWNCPTNWIMEYRGYLMGGYYSRDGRTMYECIDKDPQSLGDSQWNSAILYHVEPNCNALPCPPYAAEKELTCVVCSY